MLDTHIVVTGSIRTRTLAAVALFWLVTVCILIGTGMFRSMVPAPYQALAWGMVSSAGLLGLTFVFLRREGRPASSAGLDLQWSSAGRFATGVAVGAALYGMHLLFLLGFTEVRLESAPAVPLANIGLVAATYLALSAMEEIGFRAYALRRLEEHLGRASALALGALVFGALHLAYGWALGAALIGAGAGALLFGIAALVTRGLAVPIGLHAAWNMAGWSVGEKDGSGVWQMAVPESATNAEAIGSISYLAVMTLAVLGFWQYGRVRARRDACAATPRAV